jgi:hypothetical protein
MIYNINDKKNLLLGRSPAALYLWKMENKLDDSITFCDTCENQEISTCSVRRKWKKQRKISEEETEFMKLLASTDKLTRDSERAAIQQLIDTKASERDMIQKVIVKNEDMIYKLQFAMEEHNPDSPIHQSKLKTVEELRMRIEKYNKRYDDLCKIQTR